jgi:hypothetical protein
MISNSTSVASADFPTPAAAPADNVLFFKSYSSTYKEAVSILHAVLPDMSLTNIQELVFVQSWEGQTYLSISAISGYDADYLKDVGHKLWQILSKELGENVSKNNLRSVLRHHLQRIHPDAQPSLHLTGTVSDLRSDSEDFYTPSAEELLNLESARNLLCDWGEAPDLPTLLGRTAELETLKSSVLNMNCRLVGLFGIGGVGKTALAVELADRIKGHFEYFIWRSLRNAPDFDGFIVDLLQTLSGDPQTEIPESPDAKISLLIDYLRNYRCLLVIDDWGSTLQGKQLAGAYRQGYENYGQLLRRVGESRHQSCVVITSREKPVGNVFRRGNALPVQALQLAGLSGEEGQTFLQGLGLLGTEDLFSQLLDFYAGNPLILKAIAGTVIELFDNSIVKFLEQDAPIYGEVRSIIDQQINRLSELEKLVIAGLAHCQGCASLATLQQELGLAHPQEKLLETLESLHRRSLLQKEATFFSQSPMIRDYILMERN